METKLLAMPGVHRLIWGVAFLLQGIVFICSMYVFYKAFSNFECNKMSAVLFVTNVVCVIFPTIEMVVVRRKCREIKEKMKFQKTDNQSETKGMRCLYET